MHILIIGCGNDQKKLIHEAKKNGFHVTGIDRNKKNFKNVDRLINVSTYDSKKILNIFAKNKSINFQAVITNSSSKSLVSTVLIAKKFNLPNYGIQLVNCSLSKKKLYDFCLKNKIPTIETEIFKSKKKLRRINSNKIIIKPEQPIIGKKNVYLINKYSKNIDELINKACEESLNNKAIVQPYIEGQDLNISIATIKGKIVWFQFYQEKNIFKKNNLGSSNVKNITKFKYIFFEKKIFQIIKKLSFDNKFTGFFNFTFRINNKKKNIYLYEVNPGLPGDNIVPKIFEKNYKHINFYLMDILLMSGIKYNKLKKRFKLKNKNNHVY
jgi:phosphoribosylamine-glycine ligase